MNKSKALLMAGIIGLAPISKKVSAKTQQGIEEREASIVQTISSLPIERIEETARDSMVKEIIKNITKELGEGVTEEQIANILNIISKNLDQYISIDKEGNIVLNETKFISLINSELKDFIEKIKKQEKMKGVTYVFEIIMTMLVAASLSLGGFSLYRYKKLDQYLKRHNNEQTKETTQKVEKIKEQMQKFEEVHKRKEKKRRKQIQGK